MRLCFFDTKPYDREFFDRENEKHGYEIIYHEEKLNPSTAVIAAGCDAACAFVNDDIGTETGKKPGAGGDKGACHALRRVQQH